MSALESHDEFIRGLPRGPLLPNIQQVDVVLLHGNDPNAIAVARHSLREMAIATSNPDWVLDGMRRQVLDEFTTALAQVTAASPRREL